MTCTCTIEYDDGDPKAGGSAFIHHCHLCKAAGALLEAAEYAVAANLFEPTTRGERIKLDLRAAIRAARAG